MVLVAEVELDIAVLCLSRGVASKKIGVAGPSGCRDFGMPGSDGFSEARRGSSD